MASRPVILNFSRHSDGQYERPYTPFVSIYLCFCLTFTLAILSTLSWARSSLSRPPHSFFVKNPFVATMSGIGPAGRFKTSRSHFIWVLNSLLLGHRMELLSELCKTPGGCQNWPCTSAATWRKERDGDVVSTPHTPLGTATVPL